MSQQTSPKEAILIRVAISHFTAHCKLTKTNQQLKPRIRGLGDGSVGRHLPGKPVFSLQPLELRERWKERLNSQKLSSDFHMLHTYIHTYITRTKLWPMIPAPRRIRSKPGSAMPTLSQKKAQEGVERVATSLCFLKPFHPNLSRSLKTVVISFYSSTSSSHCSV